MSNELFNNQSTPNADLQQESQLIFVGDGKKYSTNEELDKAYGHLNDHAGTLETENATLREQLAASTKQASAVDKVLKALKGDEVQEPNQDPATVHPDPEQPDLADLVQKALVAQQAQTTAQTNTDAVRIKLTEKYGDKAGEIYAAKGKSLGVDLDALGEQSSEAVLALFNEMTIPTNNPAGNSFNSGNLGSGPANGTHEYWNKQHAEGKITRDEKFRQQNKSLSQLGPDKYWSKN